MSSVWAGGRGRWRDGHAGADGHGPDRRTRYADTTALVLALLGIAMLVGTFVANRRFARPAHAETRDDD